MELTTFIHGSAHNLHQLADQSVQMIATSPPYHGLRAYAGEQGVEWPEVTFRLNEWVEPTTVAGCDPNCAHEWGGYRTPGISGGPNPKQDSNRGAHHTGGDAAYCAKCGGWRGGLGMEPNPVAFIGHLILCLREWRRVLRDDGTIWVNLGDSYAGSNALTTNEKALAGKQGTNRGTIGTLPRRVENNGVKPKDLLGIPWLFAIAARADGWYLRSDIIWCLSGGTVVYAKTQKGVMPMTIKDMARLDPATVQLWNGQQWTQLLGMSKSARKGDELELVLRSGERISCTPTHRFPTQRGIVEAGALNTGDVITRTQLPEPTQVKDGAHIGTDAAWLAGLYLAEGSRAGDTIQLAGHASQLERLERVQRIAAAYGGSVTCTVDGNTQSIRVYGKVLNALIDELVTGSTAKDKGFAPVVWRYSNAFVSAMLDGYLSGDGHWDALNKRWRLGFTRNYNLERDLRTACARLGYQLTLKPAHTPYNGKQVATFRGGIRMERSGHHNECDMGEVVEIRKARCREVYDLGVADEPHLFALASGVLTHNSKPNPMPESVTDRPTKSHEYVFLLSKSQRYFWDAEAVREDLKQSTLDRYEYGWNGVDDDGSNGSRTGSAFKKMKAGATMGEVMGTAGRNIRTVWTIATQPTPFAHFATWPEKLVQTMIRAGSSERGACPHCGKAWVRVVERTRYEPETVEAGVRFVDESRGDKVRKLSGKDYNASVRVVGETWQPACTCPAHEPVPCVVLDPFNGSGTTGKVAVRLGRAYVGVDISHEYLDGVTAERFGAGVQIGMGI